MKKLISWLLCLILVCSMGMTGYAVPTQDDYTEDFLKALEQTGAYEDVTLSASVPMYSFAHIFYPDMTYGSMVAEDANRSAAVLQDQTVLAEAHFIKQNGEWRYSSGMESDRLSRVMEKYGTDFLYVLSMSESYAVFPDEPNTMYSFTALLDESKDQPAAYEYTLEEFVLVMSYDKVRETDGKIGSKYYPVNDDTVTEARAYWAANPVQEKSPAFVLWPIFAILVIAAGAVTVMLVRRKKISG